MPYRLLAVTLACFVVPVSAAEFVLVSANNSVTVHKIDAKKGTLTTAQTLPLEGAGPIGFSPDKKIVYVSAALTPDKKKTPAIATLTRNAKGQLQVAALHEVKTSPGYLDTDASGNFLAGSHYSAGAVSMWKLEDGIFRGTLIAETKVDDKAHSSIFSPDGQFLYVPTTEPNKVYSYRVDAKSGAITPTKPAFASGPQEENAARQPRHLIFHPTLPIVYTILEREKSGVGVWSWDATTGQLACINNIVTTLPELTQRITTAEIHLTPNNRFLYISSRDENTKDDKTGGDHMVGFRVDEKTGGLTLIGHFPCESIPRFFGINATGDFLYVGGQGEGKLGCYRINQDSGKLEKFDQVNLGGRVGWVATVTWE
jgi:6-phosphogluconolactonase